MFINYQNFHVKIKSNLTRVKKNSKAYIDESIYYPSHVATDFYNHYKEDIALMAEMGFNCFRMSINWSRIYPNGNDEIANEEGLKFYDDVFDELLKHGIEPVVTIHFDIPLIYIF